ncbi:MAG TPA: 50S ribosomal protein L4 [Candidatus Saccharimonadales bacterium]|nr:50S ribosomal protein L4 [Candidatus Saccharimonadales bacterium]
MAVQTYTKAGTKATTPVKLDKKVFAVEAKNHDLVKAAYDAYMANGRINLAVAKTRGLVRGGGKKPWRQKGTGRARAGSSRSPIWTGGGITFGPTGEENYSKRLNTKAKRLALRQALSLKADNVKVIEAFESKDGKTAPVAKLLEKIEARGNILLVVEAKAEELEMATRNIQGLKLTAANYLNVYDIVNADCIVVTKPALEVVNGWLGKEAK